MLLKLDHVLEVQVFHLSLEYPLLLLLKHDIFLELLNLMLQLTDVPLADMCRHCTFALGLVQSIVEVLDLGFEVANFVTILSSLLDERLHTILHVAATRSDQSHSLVASSPTTRQ